MKSMVGDRDTVMRLSIINEPHWFLLNDKTVDRLAELCKSCSGFKQIIKDDSQ